MKISEVVEKLLAIKEKEGDIEVVVYNEYSTDEDYLPEVSEVFLHETRTLWDDSPDVRYSGPGFREIPWARVEIR